MDGWNTILSFGDGLFSEAMLVSGSVNPPPFFRDILPQAPSCCAVTSPVPNFKSQHLMPPAAWGTPAGTFPRWAPGRCVSNFLIVKMEIFHPYLNEQPFRNR